MWRAAYLLVRLQGQRNGHNPRSRPAGRGSLKPAKLCTQEHRVDSQCQYCCYQNAFHGDGFTSACSETRSIPAIRI